MTLGLLFWILMLLWLVLGVWMNRANPLGGANYALGFLLFLVLGYKVFGSPITG